MAYIRKFKTGSGKTGVEVLWKSHSEIVRHQYVGSAGNQKQLDVLLREAQGIIDAEKTPLFNLSEFDKK